MDPTGTVTKYYPFLSEETKSKAESIFQSVGNYQEFADKLADVICKGDASEELVMLGVRVAFALANSNHLNQIADKYQDLVGPQVWILWGAHFLGLYFDTDTIHNMLDTVIDSTKDSSLKVEAQIMKAAILPAKEGFELLEIIGSIIDSDETLSPFKALLYTNMGSHFYNLDEYDRGIGYSKKGLEIARENDDEMYEIQLLLVLGNNSQEPHLSIEYLKEVEAMCLEFGISHLLHIIYNNLGFENAALGEYDKAITYYNKGIEVGTIDGTLTYTSIMNLGILYGNIGKTENSLELTTKALKLVQDSGQEEPAAYTEMARALILSDQHDKAFEFLETGGKYAFESGSKKEQGRYYLVRGILARERGNLRDAMFLLERGLALAEEIGNVHHILQILFNLAETEIIHYAETSDQNHITSSSLALSKIEQIADEQRLPGLLIQVAILKSEVERLRGKTDKARIHLERAKGLFDTFKMNNLREKIELSFKELGSKEPQVSALGRIRKFFHEIVIPSTRGRKVSYEIYGCIVIMQEAGLEVYSQYADARLTSDPSLVAGLITAVSSFTKELKEDAEGSLQSIVHQDIAVLLEHGKYSTCAVLASKDTYEARILERRFLEAFETKYDEKLKQFMNGMISPLDADDLYDDIF